MLTLPPDEQKAVQLLKDLFVFHGNMRIKPIHLREKMFKLEVTVPSVITDKAQDAIISRFVKLLSDAFPKQTFLVTLREVTLMEFSQGKFYTNQSLIKFLSDKWQDYQPGSFYRHFFLMLDQAYSRYMLNYKTKESELYFHPNRIGNVSRYSPRWKASLELIHQLGRHTKPCWLPRDEINYTDKFKEGFTIIDNINLLEGIMLSEQRHTKPGWLVVKRFGKRE